MIWPIILSGTSYRIPRDSLGSNCPPSSCILVNDRMPIVGSIHQCILYSSSRTCFYIRYGMPSGDPEAAVSALLFLFYNQRSRRVPPQVLSQQSLSIASLSPSIFCKLSSPLEECKTQKTLSTFACSHSIINPSREEHRERDVISRLSAHQVFS